MRIKLFLLGITMALFTPAFTSETYAQKNAPYAVIVDRATPVEAKIISRVSKNGKKENITAIIGEDVRDRDDKAITIRKDTSVEIGVIPRKMNGRTVYIIDILSTTSVDGQKIELVGHAVKYAESYPHPLNYSEPSVGEKYLSFDRITVTPYNRRFPIVSMATTPHVEVVGDYRIYVSNLW